MITKEAIELLSKAEAITAASNVMFDKSVSDRVALPDNFTLHDIEDSLEYRIRARGSMKTSAVGDFANYVVTHSEAGAMVFVDHNSMQATAVLNLGTPSSPGHCDNTAVFVAESTAAFDALKSISGSARKQQDVAEFFEDWQDHMSFADSDGAAIAPGKAIAAIRKLTIEAMRKVESEEGQLSASKSAFESIKASSVEMIPTRLSFTCLPYKGLLPRTFELRLSILTTSDKPSIVLRLIKFETHREEMASELVELVESHLTPASEEAAALVPPVLIGTYTKRP